MIYLQSVIDRLQNTIVEQEDTITEQKGAITEYSFELEVLKTYRGILKDNLKEKEERIINLQDDKCYWLASYKELEKKYKELEQYANSKCDQIDVLNAELNTRTESIKE